MGRCIIKKRSIFSLCMSAWRPFQGYVWIIGVITLIWSVEDSVIRPYVLKMLLDALSHSEPIGSLCMILLLYGTVRLFMTVLLRASDWSILRVIPGIKGEALRVTLREILLRRPRRECDMGSGAIVASMHAAADGMPYLIVPCVSRFLGSLCRVALAIASVWLVVPAAASMLSLWVLCFIIGGLWWGSRVRSLSDVASGAQATVLGVLVDIVNNISSILSANSSDAELAFTGRRVREWIAREQARDWHLLMLYCVQGASFLFLEMGVLWMAIRGYQSGDVSIGDIGLLTSVNMVLIEALWDIPQEISQFVKAIGRVSQGLSVLDRFGDLMPVDAPLTVPVQGAIIYDHVYFSYPGASQTIFNGLSLNIPAGQRVGIVGFSGAGKSTLVRLLMRAYDIDQGAIKIDGYDIRSISFASLHSLFAYIPQDPELFHRSMRENMCYGAGDVSDVHVREIAEAVGLHELISSWPSGYESMVGERGTRLSGGQRQAVIIARALLRKARIIIWDEATSALDSEFEKRMHQALNRYGSSVTTLVIAHRLSTLLHMDRIVVIHDGVCAQDGSHEELLQQAGVYRRLWESQICQLP